MLNSLKGIPAINGKKVMTNEDRPRFEDGTTSWHEFDKMREEYPICIDLEKDMISFKTINVEKLKEVKEIKHCEPSDIIATALVLIDNLPKCAENFHTALKLQEALHWQKALIERVEIVEEECKPESCEDQDCTLCGKDEK